MKIKQLLLILFVLILSLSINACARKTDTHNKTNNNQENLEVKDDNNVDSRKSDINSNQDIYKENLTKEEYKDILVKNYEKYIRPLDLSKYDDLDDMLINNNDNKKFVEDFKIFLKDGQSNIQSFEKSIDKLKIEDSKLQSLNDRLITESKLLLNDLNSKELELEKINNDVISRSSDKFLNYIEEKLDRNDLNKNKFEDTIEEIERLLGIDLEEKSKTNR